jgi:hypothetical protein
MSPQFVFLGIGFLGLVLGVFSAAQPKKSISLYQSIMERFNWKVTPIDGPREVRSTRNLGIVLTVLSLAMIYMVFSRL